ncbi:MAG: LPS export ABC transporter periplasmic protein LptC [Proteobacteria bacterium]|nr:LPS export ABC transporter periplasmic protein LptC [Pseudomonadota bacterium]
MRIQSANLLPLMLLTLLAALTFWLERATQGDSAASNGKGRHDPDFIVSELNMRQFNLDGSLKHALTARKMLHYTDDDSTVVTDPALTFYAHAQPTRLGAHQARVSQDGKEVRLTDDVRMVRDASDDGPALVMTTAELLVYPDDETARSTVPVTITQGRSVILGTGIEVDNRVRTLNLMGRVHGTIYPSAANTP